MNDRQLYLTYVGGPTLLLEWRGLRLLTDPTFDPAGSEYPTASYTLSKTQGPAVSPERLERVDAVLLSHDHHFDNLDAGGRAFLESAGAVLTTTTGATRLGGRARGLAPGDVAAIPGTAGSALHVTGTPARHGPAHADRGPVTGFVLAWDDEPNAGVYISGDTVWYEEIGGLAQRFAITAAVLFLGAAKVRAAGDWPLTLTAAEGVEAARTFAAATIVPVHYEGWGHFTESRADIDAAFRAAGLSHRLQWLEAGKRTALRSPPPGNPR
ncbi:MAG TPA: MBL fold metallo-hydrolase [Gemmatimonadales bacterium]|nr:MBL fold metallo-hydrolase [Gemmatimonadales bacterium]